MTRLLPLVLAAALPLASAGNAKERAAGTDLALVNVAVVDVITGKVIPARSVLIHDGRISAIQPASAAVPPRFRKLDGRGGYALPGLWDEHVHLSDASLPDTAKLAEGFVQAGVTTVRDMGGNLSVVDALRELIRSGAVRGPRIFRPGPFIDGYKNGAPDRVTVENAREAEAAIAALKLEKVDFIKIHNGVSKDAFHAVMSAARRAGLKVAVHLPQSISAEEAAAAGAATLEHTETLMESGLRSLKLPGKTVEEGRRALAYEARNGPGSLIATMRSRKTCFTPTLSEYRSFAAMPSTSYPVDAPKVAPPSLLAFWDRYFPPDSPENAFKNKIRQQVFATFASVVKALYAAGVPILAGTDLGARDIYPGISLHEELKLLSDAGLSNLDVLRAATINPARCMGLADSIGSLSVHKAADILVVAGNPLVELAMLGRIKMVIIGGHVVRRIDANEVAARGH
ncbi:MAG: amidohydrolase family protein [Sphingomicrobium sp.]|nr:amidohydrolase family protein [Sphingomonadales bacterium]